LTKNYEYAQFEFRIHKQENLGELEWKSTVYFVFQLFTVDQPRSARLLVFLLFLFWYLWRRRRQKAVGTRLTFDV